jgi:hypothetical protein
MESEAGTELCTKVYTCNRPVSAARTWSMVHPHLTWGQETPYRTAWGLLAPVCFAVVCA